MKLGIIGVGAVGSAIAMAAASRARVQERRAVLTRRVHVGRHRLGPGAISIHQYDLAQVHRRELMAGRLRDRRPTP